MPQKPFEKSGLWAQVVKVNDHEDNPDGNSYRCCKWFPIVTNTTAYKLWELTLWASFLRKFPLEGRSHVQVTKLPNDSVSWMPRSPPRTISALVWVTCIFYLYMYMYIYIYIYIHTHTHIYKSLTSLFYFWPCHTAAGSLVLQPGIRHVPPALEAWHPNHWTTREIPYLHI